MHINVNQSVFSFLWFLMSGLFTEYFCTGTPKIKPAHDADPPIPENSGTGGPAFSGKHGKYGCSGYCMNRGLGVLLEKELRKIFKMIDRNKVRILNAADMGIDGKHALVLDDGIEYRIVLQAGLQLRIDRPALAHVKLVHAE